jgi:hypothetical protein
MMARGFQRAAFRKYLMNGSREYFEIATSRSSMEIRTAREFYQIPDPTNLVFPLRIPVMLLDAVMVMPLFSAAMVRTGTKTVKVSGAGL